MAQMVVVSDNGVGANVAVLDPSVIPAGVGGASWGTITGVLSTQTDLQTVLNGKTATDDPRLSDARTPTAHKTSHQNNGADEISVAGLSGLLADSQTPLTHAASHKSGGSDAIKLDELAAPTDVTTLNASLTAHGLLPKLPGGTTTFLRADGAFATPAGGSGGIQTLKTTGDQIINGTAFQNITGLTFSVLASTDYAFDFYITFRSTLATGFRFSVNGPAGVVDFFHTYQTIANSELVGVATWLQKHSVAFDQMTVTAASIAAGVDLHCRITGRFKCGGSGGTFAARVASESANTDLVIQKGSWGTYF